MNAFKRFTQSVTFLLEVFLGFGFIYLAVKVVTLIGLIGWIDSLFKPYPVLFWILWLVSRAGMGWGTYLFLHWYPQKLETLGFFWHELGGYTKFQASPSMGKDKSMLIIFTAVIIAVLAMLTELAISLCNFSTPVFLR